MSSRAKTLREKNQVVKLVKDLNKRMESFEEAVEELKIMKDTICDMNDQLAEQELSNVEQLRQLREDLRDNKLKALNEAVEDMGKIIIAKDDLTEIKNEATRWKNECTRLKNEFNAQLGERVKEQLDRSMKILELENENKTAHIRAVNDAHLTEIANLKETIERMSKELDSQKQLTADIAGRRQQSNSNRASE